MSLWLDFLLDVALITIKDALARHFFLQGRPRAYKLPVFVGHAEPDDSILHDGELIGIRVAAIALEFHG